jgi:hypothetical protein
MSATQRQMAIEESSAWEALPASERGGTPSMHLHKHMFPDRSRKAIDARRAILQANCERLWDEVANGMSVIAAADIAIAARKKRLSIETALVAVRGICEDNNWNAPKAAEYYKRSDETEKRPDDLEENWKKLRADARCVAMRMLSGEDADHVKEHMTRLMVDIDDAVSRFRAALRSNGKITTGRVQLASACRALGVPIPRKGALINEKLFRKRAQGLRVAYHPDRLGDAYDADRYNNIGHALGILEAYNEKMRRGT